MEPQGAIRLFHTITLTNQLACTLIHVFMGYILTIPSICYIPSTINTSSNTIRYFYINYYIILYIENINSIPIEYNYISYVYNRVI